MVSSFAVASARLQAEVGADHVRALLRQAMRHRFADAVARADHQRHVARHLLFRRHALQLGLFEQPVFDVERFLLRQRDVFVDRFGAAHHFDRAVVELGRDARFALVFAPGDHADSRNQNHRRIRIAHGGRVGALARLVVRRVILAVLLQAGGQLGLERGHVFGLRIPLDVERLDFGAQEVVGTGGAELRQARRIVAVDEAQNRRRRIAPCR